MERALQITDHITPIKQILARDNEFRQLELHRLIHRLRKLNSKHFYKSMSVDEAVDRILEPEWRRRVKDFSIKEWQATTEVIWRYARKLLGDVPPPEIILYPGFNRCNGRVYRVDDRPVIVCCPDFPATTSRSVKLIIAHEYVHFARWRITGVASDNLPIYANLYEEGLATWISSQLLPDYKQAEIFMSNLHRLVGRPNPEGGYQLWCRRNVEEIAKLAQRNLHARSGNETGRLFQGARFRGDNTPIRTGYYLGYRIVEMLAKDTRPRELLTLRPTARLVSHWLEQLTDSGQVGGIC